ncbi:MAG: GNAT family N-acetyltransferase [Chitinophagaceae bacterium]|nr:MAG: GNAT family N-acetyltransferase [Chitinophagaceae bacterium]
MEKSVTTEIRVLGNADADAVSEIAFSTWPDTYGKILSANQLAYMLDKFCTPDAMLANMQQGQRFLGCFASGKLIGFAAFELKDPKTAHLNKLYVLPEAQGLKAGSKLIKNVIASCIADGAEQITLNVNRFNHARHFYEKLGFETVSEVDIEIGQGYLMEDFVMCKNI